jgi:predicted AlkP superfamily pyrophosphatase or phosphodiesterase
MKAIIVLIFSLFTLQSFAQQSDSPKLVVGIVVDQMCYEYLYRYYDRYGKNGIKKLMNNGMNCRNVNYNYIPTYTGPGHASIYTGTTPSNHGIVANDWFDRNTNQHINCVEDSTVLPVGTESENGKFSPRNLKANTISDQLKLTYPGAKVISMSIKNRGAILPGGHMSDGSYWYDYSSGKFITSSFFKDQLPKWVSDFNNENRIDEYVKGKWTTSYPIETYKASGPDDTPYEHLLPGKETPTFPYDLNDMCEIEGVTPYGLFPYTPFANTYLADFAIKSIDSEGLGKDDQTDLLCISFSSTDIIGHAFGPYSVELEDTYIKFDKEIAKLISALEDKVGKHEFTIFFTADHAVVPVPQFLEDHNLPGGYFFTDTNMYYLKQSMIEQYGHDLILDQENLNIYLNHDRIDSLGLKRNEVADFTAAFMNDLDGVKRVFTYDQLANSAMNDLWMNMIRNGYHKSESGDVIFILEPGYLPKSRDSESARKGTSHGSAYSYDTHVPLIWYGKNIPVGETHRHINITDITPTLSQLLYLQKPNATTGEPILEVLED